jgi:hypothetical protein
MPPAPVRLSRNVVTKARVPTVTHLDRARGITLPCGEGECLLRASPFRRDDRCPTGGVRGMTDMHLPTGCG